LAILCFISVSVSVFGQQRTGQQDDIQFDPTLIWFDITRVQAITYICLFAAFLAGCKWTGEMSLPWRLAAYAHKGGQNQIRPLNIHA